MTNPQTWATHGYPISRQNHMVNSGWSWIDWQGMRYTQKSTYELGWPVNLFMVIFRTIYYWVCHIKECWFWEIKACVEKPFKWFESTWTFWPYTRLHPYGLSEHGAITSLIMFPVPMVISLSPMPHVWTTRLTWLFIHPIPLYNIWYPIVCPWCGWETSKKVAFWLPIANGIFRNMMDPFLLTTWLLFHA